MRIQIDLLSGLEAWLLCGLIILIAALGKLGGTLIAARFTGFGWRFALALGILMNTRGLMELIVLNVGLDLKIISPTLFAMLVLMALVTTIATSPMLKSVISGQKNLSFLITDHRPLTTVFNGFRKKSPYFYWSCATFSTLDCHNQEWFRHDASRPGSMKERIWIIGETNQPTGIFTCRTVVEGIPPCSHSLRRSSLYIGHRPQQRIR